MFDFITNLIKKIFHSKKHELDYFPNMKVHQDEGVIRCKNCEEYEASWYKQYIYDDSSKHGKWKPISDNWKKYKKCVKPKILWEYKGK